MFGRRLRQVSRPRGIAIEDNRRFPRVKAPVYVRLSNSSHPAVPTVDVGLGGLRVRSQESFRVNEQLDMQLSLPNGQTADCRVRVAWIGGNKRDGYEAGMQIVEADRKKLAAIMACLECDSR